MRKKTTIFDHIAGLAVNLSFIVIAVLLFASVEFDVTLTKKKNSLIHDVSTAVDTGYSVVKAVKGFIN